MQITTKLTMEYLKKNKKRTAGTIFAVTIVTILITVLLTIFSSYQHFRESIVRDKGNWEAEFLCVKYSDALEIAKDKNIEEASIWYDYGMSDENLRNIKTSITRIHLFGYDENKIKNSGIYLTNGRMPENSDEIVIPEDCALYSFDKVKNLGDKMELTFEGEKKNYTIVGFAEEIEENSKKKNFDDGKDIRIGAITYLDSSELQNDTIVYTDVIAKNKRKIYETAQKLEKDLNLAGIQNVRKVTMINRDELEKDEAVEKLQETMNQLIEAMGGNSTSYDATFYEEPMPTDKVIYNTELLETIGVSNGMNVEYITFITVGIGITAVIGLAGMALILTAFTITYRERITELERLTSLGMSKSQRRHMCLKEGAFIASIGLIIGIIIGFIISILLINGVQSIIINLLNNISLKNSHTMFTLYFPFLTFLLVVAIIYFVALLSAVLPLRKLKKSNIVSGIKGANKKKVKNKKTPFIISKLFGIGGGLAYKYTKREKARHANMVACITVSVFLFLIINGIVSNFLSNAEKLTYDDYKINCAIDMVDDVTNYLDEHNLANGYFVQTDALYYKEGTNSNYSDYKVEVPKEKISDVMVQLLNENKQSKNAGVSFADLDKINYSGESYYFNVLPYYFDEKSYNEILQRAGITELKEDECILVNTQQVEDSTFGDSIELTKYEKR